MNLEVGYKSTLIYTIASMKFFLISGPPAADTIQDDQHPDHQANQPYESKEFRQVASKYHVFI